MHTHDAPGTALKQAGAWAWHHLRKEKASAPGRSFASPADFNLDSQGSWSWRTGAIIAGWGAWPVDRLDGYRCGCAACRPCRR